MRASSEAMLINSLINTGNALEAENYGITSEMFAGYRAEYVWVTTYPSIYGKPPSREAIKSKFNDFPLSDANDTAFYCDEVRYSFTRRELGKAVRSAAVSLQAGDLEEAILAVNSFSPPGRNVPLVNALHDESFLDNYHEEIDCIQMPWDTLQNITGGIRQGDLWYLAARLSQGKSWSLGYIVKQALIDGRRVLFYSLEMSEVQVKIRMHTLLGAALGFDVDHIAMRDKVYDVVGYRKLISKIKEEVPGELFLRTEKCSPSLVAAEGKEVDLVVIDYVGLMQTPMGSRAVDDWRTMAAISNMLKEVAQSGDIRILAAAQINREGDSGTKYGYGAKRGDTWRPPKVKNLAQSDALGQDADVVLTHRRYSKHTMVYGIEKNRHGVSDRYYWSHFDPNRGNLEEITRARADAIAESDDDYDEEQ